jgi:RecB family exonuclease
MNIGTWVHLILEDFHRIRIEKGHFPTNIEEFVRNHSKSALLPETTKEDTIVFIQKRLDAWENEYKISKCVTVEQSFTGFLQEEGVQITGKIDRLVHLSPTKVLIIDYKTGKDRGAKFKTQATFYVLLCRLNGYPDTSEAYFDLLNEDHPQKVLRITEADIQELKDRIKACLEELKTATPRRCNGKDGSFCSWCSLMV